MVHARSLLALSVAALAAVSCKSSEPAPPEPAAPERGADAPLQLLATGDNRGEIATCGCELKASGGLARRATAIERRRALGPALVLDAGDALFPENAARGEHEKEQAAIVLEGMGAVGTQAMAVGERDLVLGVDWLKERAAAAGVPVLAANLRLAGGGRPFPGSRTIEAGTHRVGVVGVTSELSGWALPEGIELDDPIESAKAELARLERPDLVVVLAHGDRSLASRLAALPGVDLVIPSHQGSAAPPFRPKAGPGWVVGAGGRGRDLLAIAVRPGGEGPLRNEGVIAQLAEEKAYLEKRLADAGRRREGASEEERAALDAMTAGLEKRLAEAERRRIEAVDAAGEGRRFAATWIELGEDVPESAPLRDRVEGFFAENPEARPRLE